MKEKPPKDTPSKDQSDSGVGTLTSASSKKPKYDNAVPQLDATVPTTTSNAKNQHGDTKFASPSTHGAQSIQANAAISMIHSHPLQGTTKEKPTYVYIPPSFNEEDSIEQDVRPHVSLVGDPCNDALLPVTSTEPTAEELWQQYQV